MYIVLCSDNSYYCGITTNLNRRLKQHNGLLKGGAKYTRGRRPCRYIYTEECLDRSTACKREAYFKSLKRNKKNIFLESNK